MDGPLVKLSPQLLRCSCRRHRRRSETRLAQGCSDGQGWWWRWEEAGGSLGVPVEWVCPSVVVVEGREWVAV